MSLRGYLFCLIGGLVVLLTAIQLTLVHWIEQNVAKEVDVKARQYSKQIVELAVENLNQSKDNKFIFRQVSPNDSPIKVKEQRVVKSPEGNVQVYTFEQQSVVKQTTTSAENASNSGQLIDINEQAAPVSKRVLKKEFKAIVDKLHAERQPINVHEQTEVKTFVVKSPATETRWFNQSFSTTSQSQSLFYKIQMMLVIVGIIGIAFAFWLSSQFNKPLKQLAHGFEDLAKGTFNKPVPEQGVKEIRKTIFHFNKMVKRLNELTDAEKHHKEIAHLAELGEVSRGLAHALRNPIHTIGLSLEQLTENNLNKDDKQQLLKTVQDKISHLDKSIKALLTLTSNGVNRNDSIPVLTVVQDIILEYKASVNKQLTFDIKIDQTLKIIGAESEVRSIFHTLINNACESCDDNGRVKISATIIEQVMIFEVIDDGKGLNERIEKQLFQPHVSSKPEGAGMGLYIAQRLVNLHYHGTITVKNNDTIGCIARATFGVNA